MSGRGKKAKPSKVVGISKKTGRAYSHKRVKTTGGVKRALQKVNKRTGVATYKIAKEPKMVTVKKAPRYDSKKRKVTKRRLGKKV